ncbi:transcriptional repressor [Sinorhizobium meliloti WSM1022]|jgi:Fur family zinc uptake transcriptional regulator|uniref:Zinc uptake regulation protein n=5 Tax=Sinorhizobium TaxID=28105 RepID=Q92P78_RHIME|nr:MULTISPECIES: Fur family transcriptional regulator [Sinorhizobium]PII38611.1 Fur family transcriptional regulator [Sinorhizobium meliloti CCBAU 01290]PND22109.1 transcriptional repressor [Ensifer sp. MMN_5]PST25868.1 transcriptional repressor [Mesorhizobium loti]TWB03153.1 Fur family zinc uptake transcriptional regulator [Ensifer sp. SEMIA 134]TWB39529.1 Fur family zinc uptake transcriptional regulator [Ensifer sp. SEMIA 135]GCA52499.1 zinc uptake regulation protein [Sinorhizobium sp. KGO-
MVTPQLTKNQSLVMGALAHSDGPMSAYTILDKLRDNGFRAPLQVYRALDKLLEYGLVHRLESLNAFVACSCPHEHEHDHGVTAFTICEGCGQVTEFHDEVIEDRLSTLVRAQEFKTEKTTIEIRGHCKSCA